MKQEGRERNNNNDKEKNKKRKINKFQQHDNRKTMNKQV